MLVDVVAVLEVAVTVVDVVHVIVMLHDLAPIAVGVGALVVGMNIALSVVFTVVDMIDVIIVLYGLATVLRQMFVVCGFNVRHE